MRCWGELKGLRAQSVGEVMRAIFRICGNESHLGLQLVEKLATPLATETSCHRNTACKTVYATCRELNNGFSENILIVPS